MLTLCLLGKCSRYFDQPLDLLPTWILKKCVDHLLLLTTAIIHKSMDESVMALCLLRAAVTALLKRYGLDKENMKNYRPHLKNN